MPRHILFAYDHSAIANHAIEWAVHHNLLLPNDNITVATVVNEDIVAIEGSFGLEAAAVGPANWIADDFNQRVTQLEEHANKALEQVVEWFRTKGYKATPKLLIGEPGEALQGFAEASKVDMVVVGSRGLGFLKRQLLGSVSEYLTRHLKCSVLVIKEKQEKSA
ncbi:hypothetical protein J3Q64DRAFT_1697417 [Phycomyces blakesleeanus]|uniref:UspA domain-containing protein n=2 Tax=Phycomyces blakesleeanus TaxID=4837 RepID=A0A162ZX68_PHYB8|nr:hypothetical protein PHYBLDRAFT_78315 [Phycomyces blakesleeanus NRRL 1555(-)]OAD69611.1 hypothetical protein PHYBLDRAFT_78315 [Phycomyces blakesleeanus NRRL 1555(-)]|eukprot:XP_018287651.1 hypothetical protein PHYBLDRAFT_78315 [Phycomyces blakesleeanus NRRL 1555(-)]